MVLFRERKCIKYHASFLYFWRFYAKPVMHRYRWQVQNTLTTALNTMQQIHQTRITLPPPRSDCQMLRTLTQQTLII